MPRQKHSILIAALAAGGALALYALTLAPTVGAGDAAELALAAQRGAVPHPPGYPLWGMAAWLFVRLPLISALGDAAWRANLLSAVWGAAAVGGVALLARRLGLSRTAAGLAAGIVAVCPAVWAEATHAEVYTLNLFLLVVTALAGHALAAAPTARRSAAFALALTLLLTHHQANALALPLAWLFLEPTLRRARSAPTPTRLSAALPWAALAGGLLGLLPLLWVPWRALTHPELDWFGAGRPEQFVRAWGRSFYGPLRQNAFSLPLLSDQLAATLKAGLSAFGWPALALAAVGARTAWRRRPRAAALAAGAALLVISGPWLILNPLPDGAHLPSLVTAWYPAGLLLALAAGRGFDRGVAELRRQMTPLWRLARPRASTGRVLRAAMVAAAALLVALPFTAGYAANDRHADRVARWYGEDLLTTVSPGGTLFVEGDNEMFLTAYLQQVDGLRPDVRVIQRRGYVFADPFGWRGRPRAEVTAARAAAEARFLDESTTAVYYTTLPEWVPGASVAVRREGLLWRVLPTGRAALETAAPPAPWADYHAAVWRVSPARLDFLTRKCLVAYYQARAETWAAAGRLAEARSAWHDAARVGFDFPETPALLSALESFSAEATP